jgi:hypothetical protein
VVISRSGQKQWFGRNEGARMARADHRRVMSAAQFDIIPADGNYPSYGYYEDLIGNNERISDEVFEPERFKELTTGQRMLIRLFAFDGQVRNGGITQFFWNRTESIFEVADWLERLGVTELQANYERALEALGGKKYQWRELRAEFAWENFRQTYALLDLGWFDDAYYDTRGFNERNEWVVQARGLGHAMLTRLAEYVRTHPAEFITG